MQQNLQTHELSEKRVNFIVFTLLAIFPLAGMGIDLIAPSLPAISHGLNVSAASAKNLISFFLFGYALGNLPAGFLSDAWGRKKLMLSGLLVFTIASLLPIFFPYMTVLFFARFLQGFSLVFYSVLVRAIFADILPAERIMRTTALVATMWGIGPIIGPVIGGYLQFYFGWQACFYFFACISFSGFMTLLFILPETHLHRQLLNLKQIKQNFIVTLSHPAFIGLSLLMGLTYSLLIIFSTLAPFLIQTTLGHSPIYFGHIALFMGLMFLSGTILCRRILKTFQTEELLKIAIPCCLLFALLFFVLTCFSDKNIILIIISSLCMFLSCGTIFPACMSKGVTLFRHLAGSSAAIMNLINILLTALTAVLMSAINVTSAIPLNMAYLGIVVVCGICYWFFIRQKR